MPRRLFLPITFPAPSGLPNWVLPKPGGLVFLLILPGGILLRHVGEPQPNQVRAGAVLTRGGFDLRQLPTWLHVQRPGVDACAVCQELLFNWRRILLHPLP